MNRYLALDRWLESMGHPVRVVHYGSSSVISPARERRIFIQSSLFRWTDHAVEYLIRWIEEGGRLFLVIDDYDEGFLPLLEEFGIKATEGGQSYYGYDSECPSFDHDFILEVSPADDVLSIKDRAGDTRLVQARRGMGHLIVSGRPRFLLSSNIGNAPNARLAWALFAEDADPLQSGLLQNGWLFIRGATRIRGILGTLFSHGNLAVLAVSVLVLLVVGFWAVIPRFGLVRGDDDRPGKPLRERFLAEGRFLKRYGGLGSYRDVYVREIKRRLARKEGISTDDEIIGYIQGKQIEEQDMQLFVSALRGKPFAYSEFPKMITVLKNILERI
jgi:hypothetical protein